MFSAVTGLYMFFAPHPARKPVQEAVEAAVHVRPEGFSLYGLVKDTHEWASLVLAVIIIAHVMINWKSLKSYLVRK